MHYLEKINKLLCIVAILNGCKFLEKEESEPNPPKVSASLPSICPENICKEVPPPDSTCSWQVRFSPNGGAEQQVVDNILKGKDSIYMLSYSFTSKNIAESLVYMRTMGSDVQVILDSSNETAKSSEIKTLLKGRVITYIDDKHAIAHNKVVILNKSSLLTGSFNFTRAAEKSNAENSLLLKCPSLAQEYLKNFEYHKSHSRKVDL